MGATSSAEGAWVDVDSWRENEKRWEDLRDANGYIRDTPEGHAIWMVIEGLRDWDLATALYNGNSSGIFLVHDVDAIVAGPGHRSRKSHK